MSQKTPVISIVTPSFNQAEFLESTMRSVLDQGYPDLEYVVVDGGSSDDSPEIIERYADRLTDWTSEKDNGHAHALNKGFAKTTGEIMGWLNSDDMHLPWTLKIVAEIFTQFPQVEWITGLNGTWSQHGAITETIKVRKNEYDFFLGDYAWIQQESVFWRRSLWEKSGAYIDENIKFMVDGELWTRFFQHAQLYSADCLLAGYRKHFTNRTILHEGECHREMQQIIRKFYQSSSEETRQHYARLRQVKRLLNSSIPGRWRFLYPAARKAYASSFKAASYTDITYQNQKWALHAAPFELSQGSILNLHS